MAKIGFVIPGDPDQKTGGYIYNANILYQWKSSGIECELVTIPYTSKEISGHDREIILRKLTDERFDILLIDGLGGAWMADELQLVRDDKKLVYLEHLPLKEHWETEKKAINLCDRAVATSKYSKNKIIGNGIEIPVEVVEPGDSTGSFPSKKNYSTHPSRFLFIGSLSPRKDPASILEALTSIQAGSWSLDICGSWQDHSKYARDFLDRCKQFPGIRVHKDLDSRDLFRLIAESDLLLVPSREETYGMAVAESLSLGLPVVANDIPAFKTIYGNRLLYYSSQDDLRNILSGLTSDATSYSDLVGNLIHHPFKPDSWDRVAKRLYDIVTR